MGKIKNDIILIIVIASLIISSFVWWFIASMDSPDRLYVNIYSDDKLLYSTPLDENHEYKIDGKIGEVIVVIEDGYVCIKDADCPNHLCMLEGKKKNNNDTITCLPNLVFVKIGGHIDV